MDTDQSQPRYTNPFKYAIIGLFLIIAVGVLTVIISNNLKNK